MPTIEEMQKKARKAKMQKGKLEPLSYDVLHRRIAQRPTVAVMTREQARSFNVPGLCIVRTYTIMPGTSLTSTLRQAFKATRAKKVNLLANGLLDTIEVPMSVRKRGLVKPLKTPHRRRIFGPKVPLHRISRAKVSSNFDIGLDFEPDGTPVVVLITSTQEIPPYKVRQEVREHKKPEPEKKTKDPAKENHTMLKEPLTDDLLIEAMRQADADLLGKEHAAQVKWEENGTHHERPYNDHHLLVCLFFYIYFHRLYSTTQFYSDQRSVFFDFCTSCLPGDFVFNKLRSFQKAINQLQVRRINFEDYCEAKKKPDDWYEKEKPSLPMWYAIYQKAALSFEKALSPEVKG